MIDFEKFLEFHHPHAAYLNQTYVEVCVDAENKEYQKCGNKCVVSCRDTFSSLNFSIPSDNCSEKKCIEGCFCKHGYVRHHDKCVLAKECPIKSGRALEPSNEQSALLPKHLGLFSTGTANSKIPSLFSSFQTGCFSLVFNFQGMCNPITLIQKIMSEVAVPAKEVAALEGAIIIIITTIIQ